MAKKLEVSIAGALFFTFFIFLGDALAADAEAGAKIYKSLKCAACHGADGKGQGPAAKAMKLSVTDWTDKAAMEKLKDDYLKDIITKGGKALEKSPRMPAYAKKLKSGEDESLAAYIRSFAK